MMKTTLATVFAVCLFAMPVMAESQMVLDEAVNGNYALPMQPDYNPSVWGEDEVTANFDDASALNEIAPAAGGDTPKTGEMKTMMEDFDKKEMPSETGAIEGDVNAAPYLKAF